MMDLGAHDTSVLLIDPTLFFNSHTRLCSLQRNTINAANRYRIRYRISIKLNAK